MKNEPISTEYTAPAAEKGADVAQETTTAKKRGSRKQGGPKAAKPAAPRESMGPRRARTPKGPSRWLSGAHSVASPGGRPRNGGWRSGPPRVGEPQNGPSGGAAFPVERV
jgi:hypothetical protein